MKKNNGQMSRIVNKASNQKVTVTIPGSKSVTHRALIIAGLAKGESLILNPLDSEDTRITAQALRDMGIEIPMVSKKMKIRGSDGRVFPESEEIYLKDSGTSMRFFTAIATLGSGEFYLTGSERLQQRPVGHLVEALKTLGADIRCRDGIYPPVVVKARGLRGGEVVVNVKESSQYLSALLLILPYAEKKSTIHLATPLASKPYVDITIDMMRKFDAEVEWLNNRTIEVSNLSRYAGRKYNVEGDCSSAAYFWAAAAILGAEVTTVNVTSDTRQGDFGLLDILEDMGCRVIKRDNSVVVTGGELRGIDVDMNLLPDQVPTLAIVASFAEGTTSIRNVAHLRIKESDRLSAVASELKKTGIKVEEKDDGLVIYGGQPSGAEIETYNDHRIAMAFAVMGLKTGNMKILNPSCVRKSFPNFWDLIENFYS